MDHDENRHPDVAVEAWWWWGATDDSSAGIFVGLELRGQRFDYRAGLVRRDSPYLYIEEIDGEGLRGGLEIKPPQLWADHICDAPMRQWSLVNETYGVLIDEPADVWTRPYGTLVPVTFDIEWHASADPVVIAHGYEQVGEFDAEVELTEGVLQLSGPARRVHVWGVPYIPTAFAMPTVEPSLRAPYRRFDGVQILQVLGRNGWLGRRVG